MSFTAGQFPSVLKIAELFPGQDNVFNTTLLANTLMERRPSGYVARFPNQGSRVHSYCVDPKSTQPFILPRSIR